MDRLKASGKTLLLIALGILLGAGTYAVASIPDSSGVITACWDHNNDTSHFGTLRVIDPSLPTSGHSNYEYSCLSNETQITWNQQGPAGPAGPAGPTGPAGPQGPRSPSSVLSFSGRGSAISLAIAGIHSGKIQLQSMSFGGTGGGTAAKVKKGEIVIVKHVDRSSPTLFRAAATGRHFPNATITLAKKSGGKKADYLKFTISTVIVTSVKTANPSSPNPSEQITLNFTKLSEQFLGNHHTSISLTPTQIAAP